MKKNIKNIDRYIEFLEDCAGAKLTKYQKALLKFSFNGRKLIPIRRHHLEREIRLFSYFIKESL